MPECVCFGTGLHRTLVRGCPVHDKHPNKNAEDVILRAWRGIHRAELSDLAMYAVAALRRAGMLSDDIQETDA